MELNQLITLCLIVYAIIGVISVMIYDAVSGIHYKMEAFEGFIVWLVWPIIMIIFIAYFLFNIKNGFIRIFKNTKNLFKR